MGTYMRSYFFSSIYRERVVEVNVEGIACPCLESWRESCRQGSRSAFATWSLVVFALSTTDQIQIDAIALFGLTIARKR